MESTLPIYQPHIVWPNAVGSLTKVGVLALQGDFREHLAVFQALEVPAMPVKTTGDLASVDALVLPGGESTVMSKLLQTFNLFEPVKKTIAEGLPVFGTCAGLIMLSREILDSASGQESFSALDVSVRRNAFGHQVDSFETDLQFEGIGNPVHAAFIRAPIVESVGPDVKVLSCLQDGRIVAVRQGSALGISFHPEITGEDSVHKYFLNMVSER